MNAVVLRERGIPGERCVAILPGQYFDAETGLHQNWHRDYDPSIGRYLQSDPIGLLGGPNTYSYAKSNPLRFSDRSGLLVGLLPAVVGGTAEVSQAFGAALAAMGASGAAGAFFGDSATATVDPSLVPPAANDDDLCSVGGRGDGSCRIRRKILDDWRADLDEIRHQTTVIHEGVPAGTQAWLDVLQRMKQFNAAADRFDQRCSPPYGFRYNISPHFDVIPGRPTLDDAYLR